MNRNNLKYFYFTVLILLHFGMGGYSYYYSVTTQNTDYYVFYQNLNRIFELDYGYYMIGSAFFSKINSYLANYIFGMEYSFWMFSLLYATLSFIPYYVIFRNNFEVLLDRSFTLNKITLMLLLFLPTPHFWLASFSKDSLCFLLVFTLIYLFNNVKTKYKYLFMIFLFILLLLVRPYVGFILIATFLCTEVLHFKGKVNIRRLYVAFFLSVFSILISIYFIHYSLSVEVNTPWQFIQDSYAVLEGYSSKRSSSSAILSLQNTIFPERLLYILYRPTVFEATSIYQWAVAIENLVLVIYSLLLLFFSRLKAAQPMIMSYGFYGLFTFLFYGLYVFNYGQASRMKANYIIFLLLYLFVAISNKKSLKLNKQNV